MNGCEEVRVSCPGCTLEMTQELYESRYGLSLEVDVCHHCNGLWFDGRESLSLSPRATLELFKTMAARAPAARATLVKGKRCLRCTTPLRETHDMIKGGRYTYFTCETHGRYLTFFQFLREKGLLRSPSIKELAHLRATVAEIQCSNCGASVALARTQTCAHCQAPISILARETIEAQVKALNAQVNRPPPDPRLVAAQLAMVKEKVESQYAQERQADLMRQVGFAFAGRGNGVAVDLVIGGLKALFG